MGGYLDILRSPAGTLMVVSGLARLAWGVEGLALVFHVEDAADSFAAAGLAVGALGVTSAVFAPLRGALVDRHGGPVMLSLALVTAALIVAIAVTPAVGPQALSYIVLAGLAGGLAPPFTAWTRAGLARRLSGERLRHAYAVDNVFEESAFVVGPLLAGLVIAVATPGVALGLAAGLAAFGGLALTLPPAAREWAPPRRAVGQGSRTGLNRPLAVAFVCLAGLGAGVGFVEVAVAAFAEGEGSEGSAGLILAGLSAGGILGAVVYGARTVARVDRAPVRRPSRSHGRGPGAARRAGVRLGHGSADHSRRTRFHAGVHRQLAADRGALARPPLGPRVYLGLHGDERRSGCRGRGRRRARRRARDRSGLHRGRCRGPCERRARAGARAAVSAVAGQPSSRKLTSRPGAPPAPALLQEVA